MTALRHVAVRPMRPSRLLSTAGMLMLLLVQQLASPQSESEARVEVGEDCLDCNFARRTGHVSGRVRALERMQENVNRSERRNAMI